MRGGGRRKGVKDLPGGELQGMGAVFKWQGCFRMQVGSSKEGGGCF
jgi:hypothetical protein